MERANIQNFVKPFLRQNWLPVEEQQYIFAQEKQQWQSQEIFKRTRIRRIYIKLNYTAQHQCKTRQKLVPGLKIVEKLPSFAIRIQQEKQKTQESLPQKIPEKNQHRISYFIGLHPEERYFG